MQPEAVVHHWQRTTPQPRAGVAEHPLDIVVLVFGFSLSWVFSRIYFVAVCESAQPDWLPCTQASHCTGWAAHPPPVGARYMCAYCDVVVWATPCRAVCLRAGHSLSPHAFLCWKCWKELQRSWWCVLSCRPERPGPPGPLSAKSLLHLRHRFWTHLSGVCDARAGKQHRVPGQRPPPGWRHTHGSGSG